MKSGDLTAAIESYRSFVSLDPNLPDAALASLAAADLMFEAGQVEEVPRRVLRQQLGRDWHKLVGDEVAPDSDRSDAYRRR